MKPLLRWVLPLLAASMVAIGVAHAQTSVPSASATWPATCQSWSCVDRHLNALDTRQRAEHAARMAADAKIAASVASVNTKLACLSHLNVTQKNRYVYDANQGQYVWMNVFEPTQYGENVDYQLIWNTCSPSPF